MNRNISGSINTNAKGENKNKQMDFSVSTGGGSGVYRRVPGGRRPHVGKPAEKLKGKKLPFLTVSIYWY